MATVDTVPTPIADKATANKWTVIFRRFASLSLSTLIILLALRILEWCWNGFSHQFPENALVFFLNIIVNDLVFFCKFSLVLMI
ncbi:MAG: hypothetical protein J7578_15760, partial [Chitinophagaceae bacterium]|nr:hypothetical protein [Chitinophagaceae bacterium]